MVINPSSARSLISLVLIGACLAACDRTEPAPLAPEQTRSASRPVVYTVNYPLYYFATRIAGERAEIVLPAPADVDPAFWQPDAETIRAYQQADLILLNGAGYARWAQRAALPESRVLNTSAGFRDQYLQMDDVVAHSHGPQGQHEHGATDFNTWLDPQLALQQARAIHQALRELMPDHEADLQANAAAIERDLAALDSEFQQILAQLSRPLIASHPVYNYLARRYGLALTSLHWEPEEMPTEAQWQQLARWTDDHANPLMIWEGQPFESIRERLEEMNVPFCVVLPCGNRPDQGDYLSTMRNNLAQLKACVDTSQP